jgi:hypothetical protein
MSMDNYACYADTIKEAKVKELCPKEFEAFMDAINESQFSLGDFAREYQYVHDKNFLCESKEEFDRANELFENLCVAFEKATKVDGEGLSLGLVYHEADNRGDELDGVGWTVDGHRTWTPAGKKFQDDIVRLTWTEFS